MPKSLSLTRKPKKKVAKKQRSFFTNLSKITHLILKIFNRKKRKKLLAILDTKKKYLFGIALEILVLILLIQSEKPSQKQSVTTNTQVTQSESLPQKNEVNIIKTALSSKPRSEVFGFAPYWSFNNLDAVDFNVLTTFAYFGIEAGGDGNLQKYGPGYETFISEKATQVFKKAHDHGTKVVLTLTQMNNYQIELLMGNPYSQDRLIDHAVAEVKNRGIDGINVDFEYQGDPGDFYRNRFSRFVEKLTNRVHSEIPNSKVTVSVYAASVKEPKIYDIKRLSQVSDGIFMMAYDFAVAGSDHAIPTAPLNGHKEGKYWYDIATAVDDFLNLMPAEKLILGVPWYGYNYLVYEPGVKAQTRPFYSWRGTPTAQTYSIATDNINENMPGVYSYTQGWDEYGKVGWKAYYRSDIGSWRMVFLDDTRSLEHKYSFAKTKGLAGVGIWALGFEDGKKELWEQLSQTFGLKDLADRNLQDQS